MLAETTTPVIIEQSPTGSDPLLTESQPVDVTSSQTPTEATTTTTSAATSTTELAGEELESPDQQSNPAKRSTVVQGGAQTQLIVSQSQMKPRTVQSQAIFVTQPSSTEQATSDRTNQSQQPMLLNGELIDKLMSNRTLVNLMSSQLKRVIDTETMSEEEKQRLVRQVFDQMMEEKVDFSMNNVRLAVKTVSSSYRAAVEKQRKKSPTAGANAKRAASSRSSQVSSASGKMDLKGFGRRAIPAKTDLKADQKDQQRASNQAKESSAGSSSKSFPVIDTALKLTGKSEPSGKRKATGTVGSAAAQSGQAKVDSSGNPIVVVLLPQEKA